MYIWTLVVSTVQWLGFLLSLKGGWAQHSFLSFTDFSLILTCYWARRLKTSRESWDLVQRASRVQSLLPWRIAHHWGRIAVIKAAAAFAVNVIYIDAIGHWMSIAFSIVGLMREGRGGGRLKLSLCLITAVLLGRKAWPATPHMQREMALSITRDAGIVVFKVKDIIESITRQFSVAVGNAGEWGNQLCLLVSASWTKGNLSRILMRWHDNIAARCSWAFFSWRNKLLVCSFRFCFCPLYSNKKAKDSGGGTPDFVGTGFNSLQCLAFQ